MPFKPGNPKPPGSGRKPGQATSKRETVADICARLGCDPFEGMATLADDPKTKPELRGRMYAELAQYLAPKLRAIEHTGAGGGAIEHSFTSARDVLASRIAGIASRGGMAGGGGEPDGSTGE